jgi:hypothetical protein
MARLSRQFAPRPVWLQAVDFAKEEAVDFVKSR